MTGRDNKMVMRAALSLASEGLHCFPCTVSKRPATPNGFKQATNDAEALTNLWKQYPGELIGVRTGHLGGFDVLDIDVKHPEAVDWWRCNRERFPETRIHRTRSGGLHLMFEHRDGMRCTAGKIALGVDTRGDDGYIIWWPATELPVISDVPPAPWPDWCLTDLRPKIRPPARAVRIPNNHFIAKLVGMVAGAQEGERNQLTFWAACRVGEMVASRLLEFNTALEILAEAATRAGLPRAEAERTARSGLLAGGGYNG